MTAPRRLLVALACAAAFTTLAGTAQAAAPGVNVPDIGYDGVPRGGWQNVVDSGAKQIRGFVNWQNVRGASRNYEMQRYRLFADQAQARGLRVLLTVTGTAGAMPATPGEYAAVAADIATQLRGKGVDYEVWNEEDENGFWLNGPQPAAYTALLKAAYPAIKNADPAATVLVGGMVANDYDFLEQLYANGAKGSFDAVGVHTDTACLTTDPREYYREPSGRIGRYSFTGYREIRATMLAHGDDKPVWMTELGWPTITTTCARGARAGTKAAGVTPAVQADFLTKAYGCLANDPYVRYAAWFSLSDVRTGAADDGLNLGLMNDAFVRKPAFANFTRAAAAAPIACGGTVDSGAPQVTIAAPTEGQKYLSSLPISIRATDAQGVTDIDLEVDGMEIPLKTVKSADGSASAMFEWGGAKNLAFGPHTVVALAHDEARNEGRATAHVLHVGGGAYPFKVPTSYTLKVGKVRHGKVKVRGKVSALGGFSRLAHGRAYVYFSRFDTRAGRWKKVSRYSRDAKHAFTLHYSFKKRGVWRVTGSFKPKTGFKKATTKPSRLKVS